MKPGRAGEAGVTLIEVMIVLAVIGVATGAAMLGLGALGRDAAAEQEARRLAAAIGHAVDAALISGTGQVVDWDATGYRIGGGVRHDLAAGITLARADGVGAALGLSAHADSPAADFVLRGDAAAWRVAFDGLSAVALPEQR